VKKIFSYFIVLLFSVLITGAGGYSLNLALSRGSNWQYLSTVSQQYFNDNSQPAVAGVRVNQVQASGPQICRSVTSYSLNPDRSVVDYLYAHYQDYSFSNRSSLAQNLGITNYMGSHEQNLLLITKLKQTNHPCDES
jgi:hypothetical protein